MKLKSLVLKAIIILLILSAVVSALIYWLFFDINRIPKGELIDQIDSSTGEYSIKVYLVNGGATTSYAIRGELTYNHVDKKAKNIYWNYKEETALVKWIDENTVEINGHEIDVRYQVYDWRRKSK
ncbi:DUF5412 family protein [Fusibacter bizertensis]